MKIFLSSTATVTANIQPGNGATPLPGKIWKGGFFLSGANNSLQLDASSNTAAKGLSLF